MVGFCPLPIALIAADLGREASKFRNETTLFDKLIFSDFGSDGGSLAAPATLAGGFHQVLASFQLILLLLSRN